MEDVMNLFQNLKAWTGGKENEIDTMGLDIFQSSGLVQAENYLGRAFTFILPLLEEM